MNLQDALAELVAFARENGGEERPRIRLACQRAERRIAKLAEKAERRASGRKCRRCGLGSFGFCCYRCWHAMPDHFREMWEGAKTTGGKVAAAKMIMEWIERSPMDTEAR